MPDGLTPPALPALPERVARPSRAPPPFDHRRVAWLFAAIGLLHVLGAVLVDAAMRLPPELAILLDESGLEVVLLDAVPIVPTPITQAREDRAASAPPAAASAPRANAAVPQAASPEPQVPPAVAAAAPPGESVGLDSAGLFDADGSPRLSRSVIDAAAPAAPAPDFEVPAAAGLAPLRSPVPYRPTRFEPYWVPGDETLGDEVVRRLTVEKEFKTPWGTRWRCTTVLLFSACSDVPPAPMKDRPGMPWETYDPPASDTAADDPF